MKQSKNQRIAGRRNFGKGRLVSMRNSIELMVGDEEALTESERSQLSEIKIKISELLTGWANKK